MFLQKLGIVHNPMDTRKHFKVLVRGCLIPGSRAGSFPFFLWTRLGLGSLIFFHQKLASRRLGSFGTISAYNSKVITTKVVENGLVLRKKKLLAREPDYGSDSEMVPNEPSRRLASFWWKNISEPSPQKNGNESARDPGIKQPLTNTIKCLQPTIGL